MPIFAVGTLTDHVAPWQSVYKIHILSNTAVTFLLTSGGQNAGIVSEPGHPRRWHQMSQSAADSSYVHPDDWLQTTPRQDGSWWPAWTAWLAARSGARTDPRSLGGPDYPPQEEAPGLYVRQT